MTHTTVWIAILLCLCLGSASRETPPQGNEAFPEQVCPEGLTGEFSFELVDGWTVQTYLNLSKGLYDLEAERMVRHVTACHLVSSDGEVRQRFFLPSTLSIAEATPIRLEFSTDGGPSYRIDVRPQGELTWGQVTSVAEQVEFVREAL